MEPASELGLGDSSLHRYLDGEFWSLKNELRRLLGGCLLFRHSLCTEEPREVSVVALLSLQEFLVHTPRGDAQMFIGNAMSGGHAAVFAQLIIAGRSQGPHCFIVPIREQDGGLCPGVTAVDMMHKEGLHGVDNGILIFNKVRIPRENLLDKFGSVAPDGRYHSPIKNKSARFTAMLAALTPSRLAVTFQAMSAMKLLDLCDSVKDDALRVIAAFNIPHANLHAPIAGIPNPRATWAFYPARILPLAGEGARSQRPKLGAKL
ncbi:Acyl-coenzyme A oxidase-like protein [Sciurus carolinensis]|uniref:Acyl-coenzyme A oxidase-like protein n=1 Tax=Sciurus carolinensis TaxID=30640 RepID=A0AA41N897_SCICA|nr:Acyl-coenzyme A oxidase-like protein [Sciurus carolinensis]